MSKKVIQLYCLLLSEKKQQRRKEILKTSTGEKGKRGVSEQKTKEDFSQTDKNWARGKGEETFSLKK